jgi:hypothetical protein
MAPTFEGLQDLVGGAAEDVARLVFQRLLNERQQDLVCLTRLLSFRPGGK